MNNRLKAALLLLIASALFYGASFIKLPAVDAAADNYFSESIKAAGIAYATTRGVNAVVSVVQESHIEVAPGGLGLSIAAGQVLDPINDMTERLSSMLVTAIASLGIQKLGYEIGEALSFKTIALLLLLAVPILWLGQASAPLMQLIFKLGLILLLLRFMLPLSAIVSDALYSGWLEPGIEEATTKLGIVSDRYDEMSSMAPEQNQGLFSSMTSGAADKVKRTKEALDTMVENADSIITSLLNLMTAYLAIFVVQVLLLPLAMLWILVSIFRSNLLDAFASQLTSRVAAG
jgi:hypothetical protein